jgi:hypothetical protein
MSAPDQNAEMASLNKTANRHVTSVAAARRGLAARLSELAKLAAALEEALDTITPPYLRYRIRRWLELTMLLLLTIAEIVVAETVVQALALSATATDLVAVVVGAAATGLAWLIGHEWAITQDPRAVAAGRRGWRGLAAATASAFLAANLAVRVYYGLLAEQANHLGNSLVAPLLSGGLLTAVTAALMVVAAFVTAHAETAKEAELRNRLRRIRRELQLLDNRTGAIDPGSPPNGHLSVVEK